MRAIAGVQDARTFQEARDALLRYYYPILRSRRRIDEKTPQDFENAELNRLVLSQKFLENPSPQLNLLCNGRF